jgi:hypothetical protein
MSSLLTFSIIAATTLGIASISIAAGQDREWGAAEAQAARIIHQEFIKPTDGEKWVRIKPQTIDCDENPKLKAINEKFASIWKAIDRQVADAYTEAVRPVNLKNNPNGSKILAPLLRALRKGVELRGGGSASARMLIYSAAQAEWMIGNISSKHSKQILDKEFISEFTKSINISGSHEQAAAIRKGLPAILSDIKLIEAMLIDDQKAFMRYEFLEYFSE